MNATTKLLENEDSVPALLANFEITATTKLPAMPKALPKLVRVMNDRNAGLEEIANAVALFPSIAVKLVSLANSAWSSPAVPITAIDRACSHLGLNLVRSLSLSLAGSSPFSPTRCPEFDSDLFWLRTLVHSDCAVELSRASVSAPAGEADSARSAALFSNLSLLWLAEILPRETGAALAESRESCVFPDRELLKHCKVTTGQAGRLLGRAWKLPEPLVAAMQYHGDPDYDGEGWRLATFVRLSAAITAAAMAGEEGAGGFADRERLGVVPERLDKLVSRMQTRLSSTLELTQSLRL